MHTPPGSGARAGSKVSRASATAVPTREAIVMRSYRFLDTPEAGEVYQENSKMTLIDMYIFQLEKSEILTVCLPGSPPFHKTPDLLFPSKNLRAENC